MPSSNIIKTIRNLRVLVIHPRDSDAEQLIQQVRRIGCQTEALWPVPVDVPEHADVIFVEITENPGKQLLKLTNKINRERPTLIGLVSYENPSVLESMLDMNVDAVLSKPLRPSGVLSSMVLARRIWQDFHRSDRELRKLKDKVKNIQTLSQAKFILMRLHRISEDEAYDIIRSQAMTKRTTTVEIALAIINADGILGNISMRSLNEDN